MNVIDEIKRRLSKYPHIKFSNDACSITVLPASSEGFSVTLTEGSGNGYTVSFEGWHEDFEDAGEALNVFAFGLSDECRLREYRRGGFAYKWTLESWEDGDWKEESTTALLFFPFWRKVEVRHLQNKLLSHKE
jgi:hypothetical protein